LWVGIPPDPRHAGHAIILVGHQSQLSRIADVALRGAATLSWRYATTSGTPLPVGGSEAACLRVRPSPQLQWLLTEKAPSVASELKDKLKSKVDTAKFFLGALAVNAGLLVNTNLWTAAGPDQLAVLAVGGVLIFLGLLFAVATLSGYDALNMPPEFWVEGARLKGRAKPGRRSVLRPPSEASVVLFYEMVNVWQRFFIPALVCSLAGVACFLLTLMMSRLDVLLAPAIGAAPATPAPTVVAPMHVKPWIGGALTLLAAAILVFLGYRTRGPKLGLED
jgi:hypothetical protein